jgi:hypothetical protein
MVPACATTGASNIQANYKTSTTTVGFTYNIAANSVSVTAISPNSWSPVVKTVMNITGSGFGNDASQITVYLTNSSGNIYQMKILDITDTLLKVGVPGGLPGTFDVNVAKAGFGNAFPTPATANDFKY